jgi:hypothetical protein
VSVRGFKVSKSKILRFLRNEISEFLTATGVRVEVFRNQDSKVFRNQGSKVSKFQNFQESSFQGLKTTRFPGF